MAYRRTTRKRSNVRRKTNRRTRKTSRKTYSKTSGKDYPFKANSTLVTYMSNGLTPYPRRYRCKLHTAIYGSVPAGTVEDTYYVRLNQAYQPWAGGGWPAAFPTIATLLPAGYSVLMNSVMYQRLRVFGSKITIEFLPQALTDTVQVTVTPSSDPAVPVTTEDALSQPYTKQLFMSSSKMNGPNGSSIRNYMTQARFLGVSKQAIANDLSGNYTSRAYNLGPSQVLYWIVNFTTPDKVATVTALEYRVKVTYYVEMYSDTVPDLPD